ncbi:uncharacterized protein LOC132394780 [Hypanus sabinus]|uniref:uncharacterized protein LOC132394780 n=1 Tax=Hypanus sabinus TaxID=79690 RepID=UPI0028C50A69|nr:uncharacterized protein LOC132394780 [Hypanus sabinus]
MTVKLHLRILKDIPVVKSLSELHKELMNPATDHVVCFAFTTLKKDDVYLKEATNYLKSPADQKIKRATTFDGDFATNQNEQWFNSQAVCRRLKEQAKLFHDFATANRADRKTKFFVTSVHDESILGANIYLYEGSNMKGQYFQPPSQPGRPVASGITHDSVTLQLHPPKNGAEEIVNYKVEYQTLQQEGWTTLDTTDKSHSVTISGLQPHQEYNFRYRSVTKVGLSKVSDIYRTSTRPTGPPGNPVFQDCSPITALSFDYSRQTPSEAKIARRSIKHIVERNVTCNKDGRLWKEIKPVDSQSHDNLQRMKHSGGTACGNISIEIENEPNRKVHELCKEALLVVRGNPSIYKLNLQKIVFDQSRQFVKCSFGNPSSKHRMKTIVLLGATGAGKTTLINGMINYILGVEWEDNSRYMLIHEETGKSQAESQTSSITAYQIHHHVGFKIDYSLTVIDTPGFGDTRGISRDQLITENIREFFSSSKGVHQIDAVCFVVQASLARLTDTQKYIFDSILSIFGKDITDNIQILVTFADAQFPPILEALKLADVPCPTDKNDMPVCFKFNNSAIFAQRPVSGNSANKKSADAISDDEEDDASFDEIFWKMGTKNMKDFFTALSAMKYKSLRPAGNCPKEGKQLEAPVEGLHIQIREGLSKLEEIRKTQQMLNLHQTELNANRDFEYTINFTVAVKKDVRLLGSFANNCQKCHFTCHYPCSVPFNMLTYLCRTMDWWGNCKVCPQKCSFKDHSIEWYRYAYESRTKKRTYGELKEKYEKAHGETITQENVMEILEQKFVKVRGTVLVLIEQFIQNIGNPNRLSTQAYIERMIHSEEVEALPGFEERIQALRVVKKQAELREGSHK